MTPNAFNEILIQLKQNEIRRLNLAHQHLSAWHAKQLATALHANQSLIALDISHNHMGYRGIQAIAQVLKHNQTLQEIIIIHNGLSEKDIQTIRYLWQLSDKRLSAMFQQLIEPAHIAIENTTPSINECSHATQIDTPSFDDESAVTPAQQHEQHVCEEMNIEHHSAVLTPLLHQNVESSCSTSIAAIDPIESLLKTLIDERERFYQLFSERILPLLQLIHEDVNVQHQWARQCLEFIAWPIIARKNDKIEALQHLQQLRSELKTSVTLADNALQHHAYHFDVLHRDFLGLTLFKQRTHSVIEEVKLNEKHQAAPCA